ncbi:unnamed protein product [Polarella glacialis]|uniref:Uncharacterized protein n=1 Tax=Polarella glacialis TaxID=89957 RepID=A0A813F7J5_POLGL|nr:unnamed protein product [Polarella glacialis]
MRANTLLRNMPLQTQSSSSSAGAERQRPSNPGPGHEGSAPSQGSRIRDGAVSSMSSGPTGGRPRSRITARLPEQGQGQGQPDPGGGYEYRNPLAAERRLRGAPSPQPLQQTQPGRLDEQQKVTREQNSEDSSQNRRSIRVPLHTTQPQLMQNLLPPIRHSPLPLAQGRGMLPEMSEADGLQMASDALEKHEQHSSRVEKALQTIVSEESWSSGFRPLRISFMEGQYFLDWSRALELLQDTDINGAGARLRQALTAVLRNRPPFEVYSLDFSPVSQHGGEKFELVVHKGRWCPGPSIYSDFVHFADYLNLFDGQDSVMTFQCPGSGRIFIAPIDSHSESEHDSDVHYENLASFLRSDMVPESQKDDLWLELGGQVSRALASQKGLQWVSNERGNGDERLSMWAALIVSRDCRCVIWMPYREPCDPEPELQPHRQVDIHRVTE